MSDAETVYEGKKGYSEDVLLREYIRRLLTEDPMGFVQDLAATSGEFGEEGGMFFGGDPGKGGGKAIKRAFNANADHQWLSTLDTVHWVQDPYALSDLIGRGKDELSTTMSLPDERLRSIVGFPAGLWVKGHISLAANNQDEIYTGKWGDYMGATGEEGEGQERRARSSGVNKLPTISKDYSRYGNLKPDTEFGEKMARNIPYVLDQSTWKPPEGGVVVNEALVDNWKAVGVIALVDLAKSVRHAATWSPPGGRSVGVTKEMFRVAMAFGVPIYDARRKVLWSPE